MPLLSKQSDIPKLSSCSLMMKAQAFYSINVYLTLLLQKIGTVWKSAARDAHPRQTIRVNYLQKESLIESLHHGRSGILKYHTEISAWESATGFLLHEKGSSKTRNVSQRFHLECGMLTRNFRLIRNSHKITDFYGMWQAIKFKTMLKQNIQS